MAPKYKFPFTVVLSDKPWQDPVLSGNFSWHVFIWLPLPQAILMGTIFFEREWIDSFQRLQFCYVSTFHISTTFENNPHMTLLCSTIHVFIQIAQNKFRKTNGQSHTKQVTSFGVSRLLLISEDWIQKMQACMSKWPENIVP